MRRTLTSLALLVVVGCQVAPPSPNYRFSFGGTERSLLVLAVEGDGTRPMPGDVLSWPPIVLDDVPDQGFEIFGDDWTRIHRRAPQGPQLVLLTVRDAAELAALSAGEVAGLRGLVFARWDAAIARELTRVDVRHCLLTWSSGCVVDLDSVPASARYLDLRDHGALDPNRFRRCRELRFLRVPEQSLILDDEPPPEGDGPLYPPIRLDWVRELPDLRWLDVSHVAGDLRPLAGHPHLHTVIARHSRIAHLPELPLPALRELQVAFSDCPEAEVARLRRMQPEVRVFASPRELLLARLTGATTLRLRTGGTYSMMRPGRVVYATDDAAEIAELVALLQFPSGYARSYGAGCEDRGVMQFFGEDGALLAEIGTWSGFDFRCPAAWGEQLPRNASAAGAIALQQWLAARGLVAERPSNDRILGIERKATVRTYLRK